MTRISTSSDRAERARSGLEQAPPDERGHGQSRKDRRTHGDRHATGRERPRLAAPGRQRFGIDAGAKVGAQQLDLLAEIETAAELAHRRLTFPDLVHGGRVHQPRRQRLLAGAGSRRAESLEERTMAEEIEIRRVRMRRVEKPLPRFSRPRPAILEPRQSLLVEDHRPARPMCRPPERLVADNQGHENHQRNQKRRQCQPVRPEDEPGHDSTQDEDAESQIGNAAFRS